MMNANAKEKNKKHVNRDKSGNSSDWIVPENENDRLENMRKAFKSSYVFQPAKGNCF